MLADTLKPVQSSLFTGFQYCTPKKWQKLRFDHTIFKIM